MTAPRAPQPSSALDGALAVAVDVLAGQVDKAGEPLILHVCRVVLAMDRYFDPGVERDYARVIAALHDVVEDGDCSPRWHSRDHAMECLQDEFGTVVTNAVSALTRRHGEIYLSGYIPRVLENRLAVIVKHADLVDNLRPVPGESRTAESKRINRYTRAVVMVRERLPLRLPVAAGGLAQ